MASAPDVAGYEDTLKPGYSKRGSTMVSHAYVEARMEGFVVRCSGSTLDFLSDSFRLLLVQIVAVRAEGYPMTCQKGRDHWPTSPSIPIIPKLAMERVLKGLLVGSAGSRMALEYFSVGRRCC